MLPRLPLSSWRRVTFKRPVQPSSQLFSRLVSQCAVCKAWPAEPVCNACLTRFGQQRPRCLHCALELPAAWMAAVDTRLLCPDCQRQPFGLERCFTAVPYAYPWSALISRFKFGQQSGWAPFWAALLLRNAGALALLQELKADDWLLPLPLSSQRLGERGFNQSWELAAALHAQSASKAHLSPSVLLRLRHTQAQSQLKRSERLANVSGAFAVEPLQAPQLRGRQVVLVDDVMTSGASLLAAAKALRAAGASSVSALVLARTAPT